MNPGSIAAIAYGSLAIIGGILGYTKSASKVSLISGTTSGILLLLGGIIQERGMAWGLPLSVVITAVLVITFAIRWAKTRNFMPAGLMLLAGVAALTGMLLQFV